MTFTLSSQYLAYANKEGEMVIEPGTFEVSIHDESTQFEYVQ